jgi:hypothetical protein
MGHADPQQNNSGKKTVKLIPLFRDTDWKRVFNPNHRKPRINLETLQGSATLAALKNALPNGESIDIDFEPDGITLRPDFSLSISAQGDTESEIQIPKHGHYTVPYQSRWVLSIGNGLDYSLIT